MNLNQKNVRKIRGLILFTAVVILVLMKFDLLWSAVVFLVSILRPFILGGMIAFVINHIVDNVTIADLVERQQARIAGSYMI